jgi:hypothetical protein
VHRPTSASKPPTPEPAPPKVTRTRAATPADFPGIEHAIGAPPPAGKIAWIEVATAAEMHRRFQSTQQFMFAWGDRVYKTSTVSGTKRDDEYLRFFISIHYRHVGAVEVDV